MRISYIILCLLLSSCTKDNNNLITGNIAPPDYTINRVIKENYINKLYITLLGREPFENEFNTASVLLGNDVTENSRNTLVNIVQSQSEYFDNLFNIFRQELLNGIDTNEIKEDYILVFEDLLLNSNDSLETKTIQEALLKMNLLYNSAYDLNSNKASVTDIHLRCVNNFIYDEINMGSFNYVVSIYQNFLNRYPSEYEIKSGISMVDNQQSVAFGGNGNNKNDFNTLFFSHDGYYEGQVHSIYNRLLYRQPSSSESYDLTNLYITTNNFKEVQKHILISNEYLGIQ